MIEAQAVSQAVRQDVDGRIASRLKAYRLAQGLTIDILAERSGVSRAMISKIERSEASPTALLLGKLTGALGTTLSRLFSEDAERGPLVRAVERPVWRDPLTGYTRRNVSPEAAPMDIVDVMLPPGAAITYENVFPLNIEQVVWMIDGVLTMHVGDKVHDLVQGDCLHMKLDRPITYQNKSGSSVRYAVVLMKGFR